MWEKLELRLCKHFKDNLTNGGTQLVPLLSLLDIDKSTNKFQLCKFAQKPTLFLQRKVQALHTKNILRYFFEKNLKITVLDSAE